MKRCTRRCVLLLFFILTFRARIYAQAGFATTFSLSSVYQTTLLQVSARQTNESVFLTRFHFNTNHTGHNFEVAFRNEVESGYTGSALFRHQFQVRKTFSITPLSSIVYAGEFRMRLRFISAKTESRSSEEWVDVPDYYKFNFSVRYRYTYSIITSESAARIAYFTFPGPTVNRMYLARFNENLSSRITQILFGVLSLDYQYGVLQRNSEVRIVYPTTLEQEFPPEKSVEHLFSCGISVVYQRVDKLAKLTYQFQETRGDGTVIRYHTDYIALCLGRDFLFSTMGRVPNRRNLHVILEVKQRLQRDGAYEISHEPDTGERLEIDTTTRLISCMVRYDLERAMYVQLSYHSYWDEPSYSAAATFKRTQSIGTLSFRL